MLDHPLPPPPTFATPPPKRPARTTRATNPIHDPPSPSAYAHIGVAHIQQVPGFESEPFGYAPSLLGPHAGNGGFALRYIHAGTCIGEYKGTILTRAQSVLSTSLYLMEIGHPNRVLDASAIHSCNARFINDPCDSSMENVESILITNPDPTLNKCSK